jgi:2-amino-4-hydroxy-6-hydroxymethyldihydropteridine diphosphokinase
MVEVCLGLGSNVEPEQHIRAALNALSQTFGKLKISRVFESESVGFSGNDFYNLVVMVETELSIPELVATLRAIENENGRDRSKPKFSPRTLDIDILTYGDLVGEFGGVRLPRDEILKNAFVLWPLSELLPTHKHPETGETYERLWRSYDKSKQQLAPVDFFWRGEFISKA